MMLCAAGILAVTLAVLVALSNKKSDKSSADAGVPAHTLGIVYSSQARMAKRKSFAVNAPTGQTSTVLSE